MKSDGARKESKKHQQTSNNFEHSSKPVAGQHAQLIEHWNLRHVKQLSRPVLQVQICGDKAQQRQCSRSPGIEEVLTECQSTAPSLLQAPEPSPCNTFRMLQ